MSDTSRVAPGEISPLNCIQELVERDEFYPWRVMVVCMMLNQTHGRQVRPLFGRFFELWPRPSDFLMADGERVRELIAPLGFRNRRFLSLRRMTENYVANVPYEQCYGIGKYGRDAIALFVHGRTDVAPFDTWLQPYLAWRIAGGPRVRWGECA